MSDRAKQFLQQSQGKPTTANRAKEFLASETAVQEPAEESFLGRLKVNTGVTPEMLLGSPFTGGTSPALSLVPEESRKKPISFTGESAAKAGTQIASSLAGLTLGAGASVPALGTAAIPGAIAGFGVGTEIFEGLRALAPGIFGKPRPSEEVVEEIGLNAAFDTIFGGVGLAKPAYNAAKGQIAEAIAKKFGTPFSPQAKKAVVALEAQGKKLPDMSVGIRGDSVADTVEDILNTKQKKAIVENVQTTIKKNLEQESGLKFDSLPIAGSLGASAQRKATASYLGIQAKENQAWDVFRKRAGTKTFAEPIFDDKGAFKEVLPVNVEAPVEYRNTLETIKEIKSQLEPIFGRAIANEADRDVKSMYSDVLTKVRNLQQMQKHLTPEGKVVDLPIKSYRAMQDTRRDIWDNLPNKMKVDRAGGLLNKLQAAITKDLKEAYPEGTAAGDALSVANTLTREKKTLFPDSVQKAMQGDASDMFQEALSSPEAAARLRDAIVGRKLTRLEIAKNPQAQDLSAGMLTKFWNKFTDEAGTLNPNNALRAWKDPEYRGITRELLTSRQRENIEYWLRIASETKGKISMTGKVAVDIRAGGAMINVGTSLPGIIGSALGFGAAGFPGAAATLVGLRFSVPVLSRRIFLDPSLARVAAGLPKLAADSPQAKTDVLKLLRAMKGAEAIYVGRDANGEEYEIGRGHVPDLSVGATRDF